MAILVGDRVLETSTTAGTGTLTLAGAATGYQSFTTGIGVGNQTYYCIYDPTANTWEVGTGTLLTGTTLSRTTVYANSSGTTALISFAANSKNVFCTAPATKYVDQSDVGYQPNQIPLNQMLGKLAFQDVLDTVTNNPYIDTATTAIDPSISLDFVNAKTLDPRITFTRASTATYYDGKTSALAEQNICYPSNSWFTARTGVGLSYTGMNAVTGGQTSPTGTADATLVTNTTANSGHSFLVDDAGGNPAHPNGYTFSFYAKAVTGGLIPINYLVTGAVDSGSATASFNFNTGVVTNTNAAAVSMISIGGGWYRCSVSNVTTNGRLSVQYSTDGTTTTYIGDGTSGFTFWGAQKELRIAVTPYTQTTTTGAVTNYIPKLLTAAINQPRFAANPTTAQPYGLQTERYVTNYLYYSQDFTQTSRWTASNLTVYNTYMNVAPDGTVSAQSLVEDSATTLKQLTQTFSLNLPAAQNFSCFFKDINTTWVAISATDSTNSRIMYCIYNIATGTLGYFGIYGGAGNGDGYMISSQGGPVIQPVGNGWYRCSFQYQTNATVTVTNFVITSLRGVGNVIPNATASNWAYAGNGSSSYYAWGTQFEYTNGQNAEQTTSYIPTGATQITRAIDVGVITGTNFSSWYNSNQGTMYVDYLMIETHYVTQFCYISGTGLTQTMTNMGNSVGNNYWTVSDLGINTLASATALNLSLYAENKLAMYYSSGNSAWCANGGNLLTSANTRISGVTGNTLNITGGGSIFIKKFVYYPQALTAGEILEMTQ